MDDGILSPSPHATAFPSSPPLDPRYRGLSPTSSEPPLFSSDDPPEAEDISNYKSPRYKRKRAGPWWEKEESGEASNNAKKTKLSRNFDSGVWMMSDGSFSSDTSNELPELPPPAVEETPGERIKRETKGLTSSERNMYHTIHKNVEENSTRFDFEGFNLDDDELGSLRLLNQVIKTPLDGGVDVPAEGQYRSMIPELYVNLGTNLLLRLAPSLFNLQHLTSLVLRNNKIEALPPQIGKLHHLKELDLSRNKLKWLPCEIFGLFPPSGQLERLQLIGNPLLEKFSRDEYWLHYDAFARSSPLARTTPIEYAYSLLPATDNKAMLILLLKCFEVNDAYWEPSPHHRHYPSDLGCNEEKGGVSMPKFIGRTPPTYFDQRGIVLKGSPVQPSSDQDSFPLIVETNRGAFDVPSSWFTPPSNSKVRSLVNTTLVKCLQEENPAYIRSMFGEDIPLEVDRQLSSAEENLSTIFEPFRQCHCCGKEYITPMAEWLEFWVHGLRDFIPVKAQVCSWGCVPEEIGGKPKTELKW